MVDAFSFRLLANDGAARRGEITTPHGPVATPTFMPVGTQATVKGVLPEAVRAAGAEILLGNTYHLMLRPGAERIAALGGLHRFMNWPHAILTDSGGFQVMSLASLRTIDEEGVEFRSHLDGSRHLLTPERSIEIQHLLGADITMALDECTARLLPTRSGRTAQAFTRDGPLNLRNTGHAEDPMPLDPECRCPACAGFSRAYLHHLTKAGEILASMLLTAHNLTYYADLMAALRTAIAEGRLADFAFGGAAP